MNDSSQAVTGMIGLWLMLQLAVLLALMLGGLYALYCLSRAASGLDRLAGAVEEWVQRENAKSAPPLPGVPLGGIPPIATPDAMRPMPVPPVSPAPPSAPVVPTSLVVPTPPIMPPSPLTPPTPFEAPPLSPPPVPSFIDEAFGETRSEIRNETPSSLQSQTPEQTQGAAPEEKREF
jgi:hypothetical protein